MRGWGRIGVLKYRLDGGRFLAESLSLSFSSMVILIYFSAVYSRGYDSESLEVKSEMIYYCNLVKVVQLSMLTVGQTRNYVPTLIYQPTGFIDKQIMIIDIL